MYILEIRHWHDETPILQHIIDPAKLSNWWYGKHFSLYIFKNYLNTIPKKICRKRKTREILVWNLKTPSLITSLISLKYSKLINHHYYSSKGGIIHTVYHLDYKIGKLLSDVLCIGLKLKGRKYWKWSGSPKYRLGEDLDLREMILLISNLGNKEYIINYLEKTKRKLFIDLLTKER